MTAGDLSSSEMEDDVPQPGDTQADFIKNELNFDINPEDPMTKAALNEHPEDEWIDILGNGKLKKKVIKKVENGRHPVIGELCTLKIIGKLENGTVVEEHDDLNIQLGDVDVIQGLDLAIALMNIGEIAEVEVDSRFAYGKLGMEPTIPPDATILYTVELKTVESGPEKEALTIAQRREIGNKKRERGNWWFKRNEATLAIQCYRRALDFLMPVENKSGFGQHDIEESDSDVELQALLEDRIKVYNNLGAAQMAMEAYNAALKSIENVLSCQPQNVKALFRKGKILHLKGEHAQAYTTLLEVAKLHPDSNAVKAELAILKKKNAKDVQHEKNLYRKMLGGHKTNHSTTENVKKETKSKATSKIAWSIIGGVTAATIGVLLYRFAS